MMNHAVRHVGVEMMGAQTTGHGHACECGACQHGHKVADNCACGTCSCCC